MKFYSKCNTFVHENASENIVCEMTAILSKERWATHCVSEEDPVLTSIIIEELTAVVMVLMENSVEKMNVVGKLL